jgi:hypothetical protein
VLFPFASKIATTASEKQLVAGRGCALAGRKTLVRGVAPRVVLLAGSHETMMTNAVALAGNLVGPPAGGRDKEN